MATYRLRRKLHLCRPRPFMLLLPRLAGRFICWTNTRFHTTRTVSLRRQAQELEQSYAPAAELKGCVLMASRRRILIIGGTVLVFAFTTRGLEAVGTPAYVSNFIFQCQLEFQ